VAHFCGGISTNGAAQIADLSAIKPGAPFSVIAAIKQPDGSFDVSRINVERDGASPP
jgi:hypothetical protein